MRAPAIQLYYRDWMSHPGLRMCSIAARGLWADMMCIMAEGTPYGHLAVNGKGILAPTLARRVGESATDVEQWMAELEGHECFARDGHGLIYSPRMVRAEQNRQVRAAGGGQSTRPAAQRKRPGTPSRLFNFLLDHFGGCLWCGGHSDLELHRVVPGRKGGKYVEGNVLLVCATDHREIAEGAIPIAAILARHGVDTLAGLFEGMCKEIAKGSALIPNSIPPSVAVAVASAVALVPPPPPRDPAQSPNGSTAQTLVSVVPAEFRPDMQSLLDLVPNVTTWTAEMRAALEGMHGKPLTFAQLGQAVRDYLASGKVKNPGPSLRQFRRYMQGVLEVNGTTQGNNGTNRKRSGPREYDYTQTTDRPEDIKWQT